MSISSLLMKPFQNAMAVLSLGARVCRGCCHSIYRPPDRKATVPPLALRCAEGRVVAYGESTAEVSALPRISRPAKQFGWPRDAPVTASMDTELRVRHASHPPCSVQTGAVDATVEAPITVPPDPEGEFISSFEHLN
jgi:hypothetical protein